MLLRSTTKPPILGVLTKHHISEAFRIDFVNKSMFLRSRTKPYFFSIRGGVDQTSFFIRGVIVPPSKLIVTILFSPNGGVLLGGVNYEGGRSNQTSSFMRGVIVPPSKLIVKKINPQRGGFLLGGFIIKGEILIYNIIVEVKLLWYDTQCYNIILITILILVLRYGLI